MPDRPPLVADDAKQSPRWASGIAVAVCGVLALVAFTLAAAGIADVMWFGFPDGHVTAYEKAAARPLQALMAVHVLCGIGLARLAFPSYSTRGRLLRLLPLVIVLACTVVASQVAVPWYFIVHLGLDHGTGG